ncbi:hypothetical protein MASR2M70_15850 [Bacillota bacterium]
MNYDKRGFTLIELVVVMVLMGLILTMGFSIYRFGTDTYAGEAEKTLSQTELRAAISVITKDIRKHPGSVTAGTKSITINGTEYAFSDGSLTVNGSSFIEGIADFNVSRNEDKITISIASPGSVSGDSIIYETTITLR